MTYTVAVVDLKSLARDFRSTVKEYLSRRYTRCDCKYHVVYIRIERDGDKLIGERKGQPSVELFAETRDVLFQSDNVYLRRVFQRNQNGRVTAFVDRSETDGHTWVRIHTE